MTSIDGISRGSEITSLRHSGETKKQSSSGSYRKDSIDCFGCFKEGICKKVQGFFQQIGNYFRGIFDWVKSFFSSAESTPASHSKKNSGGDKSNFKFTLDNFNKDSDLFAQKVKNNGEEALASITIEVCNDIHALTKWREILRKKAQGQDLYTYVQDRLGKDHVICQLFPDLQCIFSVNQSTAMTAFTEFGWKVHKALEKSPKGFKAQTLLKNKLNVFAFKRSFSDLLRGFV